MLTLYKVVPERLEYYLEVTKAGTRGPFYERDGYWRSPGAPSVDTSALIGRDHLLGLGSGVDPRTGQVLNRFQRQVRTCALDMTFAAPKGVSMLFALGDDRARRAVELAQRTSVLETMDFVDRRIISVSRRMAGVRDMRHARTIDQAVFEHRVSRSLDPHLHCHVLVPNIASDDNECWSAFDFRPLYVHVGLLGALYRSGLRHHLSRTLGVRWREIQPGWYDLAGLSPPMIRAFSRRRREILEEVVDLGFASHRAISIAAGHSRPPRGLGVGYDELLEDWRARAHRLGISRTRIEEMTGNPLGELSDPDLQMRATIAGVGARCKEVMLVELLRQLANGACTGASISDLEAVIERAVASRLVVAPRDPWPYGPRRSRVSERERSLQSPGPSWTRTPQRHVASVARRRSPERAQSIGHGRT